MTMEILALTVLSLLLMGAVVLRVLSPPLKK